MLLKRGLLALAALAAVAGCNESFECAADSHCELDGVAGFCESIGHCSFPDEACDTGRRFGNLAGTLSNQCVPPAEGDATSSDVSTGSTMESSGTASTSMSMTSSPTEDRAGSSSSTDASGRSSGEGPILPCTVLYEDSFLGEAIDPTWLVQGDPVVLGGAARFTIDPEASGTYEKLVALGGSRLDLSEGSVTLELESVPQILRTQGTLSFEGPEASVIVLWESGGVLPLVAGESVDHSAMTLPWVRVAFSAGTEGTSRVVFSESEDGMDWVEFATAENVPFDASDTQVQLTAGSYDDFAIPQEFGVRWISVCGEPSGI